MRRHISNKFLKFTGSSNEALIFGHIFKHGSNINVVQISNLIWLDEVVDFLPRLLRLPQLHPLEALLGVLLDHLCGWAHGTGHVGLGLLRSTPLVDLGHALDSLGHGDLFQVGVLKHQLTRQA